MAKKKKKQQMTDESLISIIDREVGQSGGLNGELEDQRRKAIDYYNGEPFGNELEGRSSVVSTDVMDVIEWSMPILMRIFGSGDELGRFEPQNPDDVEAAEQATDYCNYVFFRENNGFKLLYDVMKDALLSKTGIFKIVWKEDEEVERESYEGLSDEEFQLLVMDDAVEVVEHTAIGGDASIQVESMDEEALIDSSIMSESIPPEHDVTIMRKVNSGKVDIEVVAPEEFYISRSARTIEEANFVCHRTRYSVGQLIELGFDDAEEYVSESDQRFDQEYVARNFLDGTSSAMQRDGDESDPSMREIWIDEAYIRCDWNGDGITGIRKVWKTGDRIILNEEVDDIPFTDICPLPMPHKFYGFSISDIVMDLQLIKSTLWRNILDNIYHLNNGRFECLDGRVNMDDLLTNRPAGVVRVKEMGAVRRLDAPDIGKSPYEMLNYIDSVRDSRTGITKFNQGLDANVLQQTTATAYMQQMQSSQARIELIARIFAETGISAMYKRIYTLLQKHSDKSKVVMLRNKWVDVDPASWRKQCDFTVRVGLGNGNREQNLVHLQSLVAMQEKIIAAGGMGLLVTPKNVFNTLKEIGMNMGLKNIEEYLTNPDEGQAQGQGQKQEDPEAGKQQVEAMKVQVDMQKLKLEARKLEIEEEKLKFEEQKLMAEMQMQREENQLKSAEMQMEALANRAVKLG
tara:strand:+ start:4295 stop:6352 length:2058 start_codon:yes stop_codon:yes gene_type:complete